MHPPSVRQVTLVILAFALVLQSISGPIPAQGQVSGLPIVGVWSSTYLSSNITDTGLTSGTLTIDVNVTSASSFNGYEFYLYYDPAFLRATSTDFTSGSLCTNPFKNPAEDEISIPGKVHLSVVNLAGPCGGPDGTLAHITFNILAIGVSPFTLAAGTARPADASKDWTRLVLGDQPIAVDTSDGYFKNEPTKLGPKAEFTFSPPSPLQADIINFTATSVSFDPDNQAAANNGIVQYRWDFGDGQFNNTSGSVVRHQYITFNTALFGNFSVRLTVVDSDGFLGMRTHLVGVAEAPVHDVGIFSLTTNKNTVAPGENVSVIVVLRNFGTFFETFNLTVQYTSPLTPLGNITSQPIAPKEFITSAYTMRTDELSGLYTVEAVVTIANDEVPANNKRSSLVSVSTPAGTLPLYLAAGAVGVAGAIVAVGVLMRRRKRTPRETE